jgi:multisubunit Na+/H+ antiporter MnhG subunit
MSKKVTTTQCKDAGLALVLISLLVYQAQKIQFCVPLAIILLIIVMSYPKIFKPFAKVWFGLSDILGTVVSKIILSALFFFLVFPIGLMARTMGRDSMQAKRWKKSQQSVFRTRDHLFAEQDLENPY